VSAGVSSLPQVALGSGAPLLEFRGVAKRFGARDVLKSISLDIAAG
jgi:ABC-type transporter Mla maintaining outer membrane lipid asymmetry ATPase subunit MlaF